MNRVQALSEQKDQTPPHSLIKRVIASGFILIILFGNLWMSYYLFSATPPLWIQWGFYLGVMVTITSGAVGGIEYLINLYHRLMGHGE